MSSLAQLEPPTVGGSTYSKGTAISSAFPHSFVTMAEIFLVYICKNKKITITIGSRAWGAGAECRKNQEPEPLQKKLESRSSKNYAEDKKHREIVRMSLFFRQNKF